MRSFLFLIPVIFAFNSIAQDQWNIDRCLDSAFQNNFTIKLSRIDLNSVTLKDNSEQYNYLPSLNFNASHGYNWGQTIDPFTNSFATSRVQTNNFSFSSSAVVFNGLQNHYLRKVANLDVKIASERLDITKKEISMEVMSLFLQVKLNKKIVSLQEKHHQFALSELEKAELLKESNYQTSRYLMETEALEKDEKFKLISAQNSLRLAEYELKRAIGVDTSEVLVLSDSIFITNSIETSLELVNQYRIEKQRYDVKIEKAKLQPRLIISGFLGTGYSGNNMYLNGSGQLQPKPFGVQFNENLYQSASLSLNVPIFNGANSYSRIKVKQLELERLAIESEEISSQKEDEHYKLKIEIETLRASVEAYQSTFSAFNRLYDEALIQYRNSTIDYYTFLQAKDSFFKAEAELVQVRLKLKFAELMEAFIFGN